MNTFAVTGCTYTRLGSSSPKPPPSGSHGPQVGTLELSKARPPRFLSRPTGGRGGNRRYYPASIRASDTSTLVWAKTKRKTKNLNKTDLKPSAVCVVKTKNKPRNVPLFQPPSEKHVCGAERYEHRRSVLPLYGYIKYTARTPDDQTPGVSDSSLVVGTKLRRARRYREPPPPLPSPLPSLFRANNRVRYVCHRRRRDDRPPRVLFPYRRRRPDQSAVVPEWFSFRGDHVSSGSDQPF